MASSAMRRIDMLAPWPVGAGSCGPSNRRASSSVFTATTGPVSPSGRPWPVTNPTAGSAKWAATRAVHPDCGRQSSSVKATIGAVVAPMPTLRASASPGRGARTTRKPAASATRRTSGSTDAESTTTASSSARRAARTAGNAASRKAGRSRVQRITATPVPSPIVPIMASPMAAPLVSVVIPTRDRADRVLAALASVERQTWTAWEAIVVDDGSTDSTPEVLAGAGEREPRVRVVRNDRSEGGSAARNRGIAMASGDVLAFLDDDDEWLPTKLTEQVGFLLEHREVGAVSCWQVIDDGSTGAPAVFRGPTNIDADDLHWDNFGGSASFCVWRRAAFDPEPRFDPELPSAQDWDVWLQCARQSGVRV